MLARLRQARRGPRWIELTRSAGPRTPFSHPSSVPEPLLVAKVRWRLDGFCVVAATNKCLAQSDKSHKGATATKKGVDDDFELQATWRWIMTAYWRIRLTNAEGEFTRRAWDRNETGIWYGA